MSLAARSKEKRLYSQASVIDTFSKPKSGAPIRKQVQLPLKELKHCHWKKLSGAFFSGVGIRGPDKQRAQHIFDKQEFVCLLVFSQ